MLEKILLNKTLLLMRGFKLFRNHRGKAWQGKTVRLKDGSVLIKNARFYEFGLYPGASDLIGWRPRIIELKDVGKKIAIFVSVEGKTKNDKLSKKQREWLERLKKDGAEVYISKEVGDDIELQEIKIELS